MRDPAPEVSCAAASKKSAEGMLLDIFSELQRPGPFRPDHEARLRPTNVLRGLFTADGTATSIVMIEKTMPA